MQSKICALAESLPLCIQRVSLRFRLGHGANIYQNLPAQPPLTQQAPPFAH